MDDFKNKTPEELDSNEAHKALYQLAERVYHRYYSGYPNLRDDLIQEGVVKGWSLITEGNYDPELGNLYNYLFTGMRNAMTNFSKKIRERTVDDPDSPTLETDFDELDEGSLPSIVSLRADVLEQVAGRLEMNIFDLSHSEKKVLSMILASKSKVTSTYDIFQRNGDLILMFLFLFAGERVTFPTEQTIEKMIRQARIFCMLKRGNSTKDVARRVGLREQHILRIQQDIGEVVDECEGSGELSRREESGPEPLESVRSSTLVL